MVTLIIIIIGIFGISTVNMVTIPIILIIIVMAKSIMVPFSSCLPVQCTVYLTLHSFSLKLFSVTIDLKHSAV